MRFFSKNSLYFPVNSLSLTIFFQPFFKLCLCWPILSHHPGMAHYKSHEIHFLLFCQISLLWNRILCKKIVGKFFCDFWVIFRKLYDFIQDKFLNLWVVRIIIQSIHNLFIWKKFAIEVLIGITYWVKGLPLGIIRMEFNTQSKRS